MPATAALWLLPFVVPIAIWVSWSDMKFMRIPNISVAALAFVFFVVGPMVLPLADWGWRWSHLAVILVIGFVMTIAGLIGAGDAKFAAAMAPFVAVQDVRLYLAILAASLIAAFVAHRALRAVPAFRGATPDWASWSHAKFPMGLALAGSLVLYLLVSSQTGV